MDGLDLSMAILRSIQVGLPRRLGDGESPGGTNRAWTTGFVKEAVAGPVWLGRTNLAGDGQADREHHGGPEQAVLAYGAEHYPRWRAELGRPDFPHGAFAENFTIAGLDEGTVCVGDSYAVGGARVQVSQPRVPCWKIARRWGMPDLTKRVERTGRTGWYLRVLEEGEVAAGQAVTLFDRPYPEWTIARAHAAMRNRLRNSEEAAALAACPLLAPTWRAVLTDTGR